ncbi:hypothetical protein Dimus_031212 [Dionaea muscipula]
MIYCSVAVGVAIQRTNGVWMHDKELKVKYADFHKKQGASNVTASLGMVNVKYDHPLRAIVKHTTNTTQDHPTRLGRPGLRQAWVPLRLGKHSRMIDSYADVVRKGTNHRSTDYLLASFMDVAEGNFIVKRMGNKKVDEDTANCARVDIGKIKVITHCMEAINHKMRLMVGVIQYIIRIAEEQVVFICNSDFRCECTCHDREDEQTHFSEAVEEDDDEAGIEDNRSLVDGSNDSRSFIDETPIDSCEHGEGTGDEFLQRPGYEESGVHDMTADVVKAHLLGNQTHDHEGVLLLGAAESGYPQGSLKDDGLGPLGPTGHCANLVLQPTVQALGNIKDFEPGPIRPMSCHFGLVFNNTGNNLEVVLEDILVNNTSEFPRNMSADFFPGKLHHGIRLFSAGSQIGKERRQQPPFSDNTACMEVADEAIVEQITVGAEQAQNIGAKSSTPVNSGDDLSSCFEIFAVAIAGVMALRSPVWILSVAVGISRCSD